MILKNITVLSLLITLVGCSLNKAQNAGYPTEAVMDKTIRSQAGGFEFRPLQGYETKENSGIVTMILPNGDAQSGPMMLMIGSRFEEEISIDQAVAVMIKSESQYTFSKSKPVKIDRINGASMEFTTEYHALDGPIRGSPGAEEGEQIRGRVILVMVSPTQQYKCVMLAPEKIWKNVRPKFEDVIDSLKFFSLVEPTWKNSY